jgi:NAD(P)-dependent dehydrogenase (short-subunit alcohol dehydrogenase family)
MPHSVALNGHPQSIRLVIGGNRGIGLALVEAQLDKPDVSRVIATHRPAADLAELSRLDQKYGGKLHLQPLDVTCETSLQAFGRFLALQPTGIDLAIHAAGLLHDMDIVPEKSLAQCNSSHLLRLFEVNSIGPLMVAGALLPTQSRNQRFTFAALSAMVGSIADNRLGGWYGYRASKTALNQFIKTMANECRLKHPHAAIVAIHPGTTDTGLSRPFQKNVQAGKLYTPDLTAKRLLDVLEGIDENRSGQFLNWDGSTIPW